MNLLKRFLLAGGALLFSATLLYGQYEPPRGGEEYYEYSTAATLGRGFSLTENQSVGSSRMNPALPADLQRVHLGASYTGLVGTSSPNSGWEGHGGFLGLSVPTRAGVITGSLAGLYAPFEEMDLGATFSVNAGFSKRLYPRLTMGLAVNTLLGGAGGFQDVGVSADLGGVYDLGNLGFLGESTLGFALLNSGKWYEPVEGRTGVPSPFTPAIGLSSQLLEDDNWSLRVGGDVRFPSAQNGRVNLGARLSFREVFSINGGWGIDARQLFDENVELRSLAPSVGISVRIASRIPGESRFIEEQGWNRSEVTTHASVAPLYNGILGTGFGLEAALGVRDTEPPQITVGYEPGELRYISPDNDGVQDDLTFDLSIEDERYVRGWTLFVYDEQGEVVREIRNKDDRPENSGLQGILDRIVAVERGVEVPPQLSWNGRSDSGERVADGSYTFVVTASDDNGNSSRIEQRRFVVDTTPPRARITEIGQDERIFSPNGDGNKDELLITQEGSEEDLWEGEITNAQGEVVFSPTWEEGSPESFVWEGRDDSGALVPDGVYEYRVRSTDRAGNSSEARLSNIIVNTVASPVDLSVSRGAFSPNNDGVQDEVVYTPSVPVESGLVDWSLRIESARGDIVRSYDGVDLPPESITFDGRDDAGDVVSEGGYRAMLSVRYQNGNNPTAAAPPIIVDLTPPRADVRSEVGVFSPNNDGIRDAARFFQDASEERRWTGVITDEEGATVTTVEWRGTPDFRYEWDGRTEEGRIAEDGTYEYRLEATDAAGNRGGSAPVSVDLDTSEAELFVSTSLNAFSPNADGARDTVAFFPRTQGGTDVESWELQVTNRSGEVVRSFPGDGTLPDQIAWDGAAGEGTIVPDGVYSAQMRVVLPNGNVSTAASNPVTLDTEFPEAEVSLPRLLFSPDGDGRRDELEILQSASSPGSWEAAIINSAGERVREYFFDDDPRDLSWDGTDEAGNRVPDGTYEYLLIGLDEAGNRFERRVEGIEVDTRPAAVFVTVSDTGFSPNDDGIRDDLTITTFVNDTEGAEFSLLEIRRDSGELVREFRRTDVAESREIPWDGTDEDGELVEGSFRARFVASYERGALPEQVSTPFVVDVTPPEAQIVLDPLPFSPDNDGVDDELSIAIDLREGSEIAYWIFEIRDRNDRFFQEFGGRGEPASKITWDGRSATGEYVLSAEDYSYTFEVADIYGNTSEQEGTIPVDILVVRDGEQLKVQISNINFAPDSPELILDPDTQIGSKNRSVLDRLAEIFEKYDAYSIKIAGHAVNISGTEREEVEELQPLSLARAEAVRDALVERGIANNRISTVGQGGTEPLVPHTDLENRWKNRRVEFILIR
ncbi:MAG: OmpA family protein [Alkalispirochaetaceae bacterium]